MEISYVPKTTKEANRMPSKNLIARCEKEGLMYQNGKIFFCSKCKVERTIDTEIKLQRHLISKKHSGEDRILLLDFLRGFDFFQDKYEEDERSSLRTVKSKIQLLNEFRSYADKPISKRFFNHLLLSLTISIYKVESYYMLCPLCFNKKLWKSVPDHQLFRHKTLLSDTAKRFSSELKNKDVSLIVMDFAADRRSQQIYKTGKDEYRYTRWAVFNGTLCSENKEYTYIDVTSELGEKEGVKIRHDTRYSINALMKVLSNLSENKRLKKKLNLWCDNGKHFKNEKMVNFLISLVGKMFEEISLNFIVPYHGKSICNKHFGAISRKLRFCKNDITTLETLEKEMETLSNTTVLTLDPNLVELEEMDQTIERIDEDTSVIRISKLSLSEKEIDVEIYKYAESQKSYELKKI